jgi:hypothetical protein
MKKAYIEDGRRTLQLSFATREAVTAEPAMVDEEDMGSPALMFVTGLAGWFVEDADLDALLRHVDDRFPDGNSAPPSLHQVLKMAVELGRDLGAAAAYENGYVNGHRDGITNGFEQGKEQADKKPNGIAAALEDEMLRVLLKHSHLRREHESSLTQRLIELTCYDDESPEAPLSVAEVLRIAHETGMEDAGAISDG